MTENCIRIGHPYTHTYTVYAESRNQMARSRLSLLPPSAIKHISPSSAPRRLCSYLHILYVSFCSCSPTSSLLYLHRHSLACFISTPADWPPSTTCYTHQFCKNKAPIQSFMHVSCTLSDCHIHTQSRAVRLYSEGLIRESGVTDRIIKSRSNMLLI